MTRNQITTADHLKVGDRFYKVKDKKKTPLQVVEADPKQKGYRTYKYWYCEAWVVDLSLHLTVHKARYIKAITGASEVVFLRHSN